MIPMDDSAEVEVISTYVANSRNSGQLKNHLDDEMEIEKYMMQSHTVTLEGNISYLVVDTNFILSHLNILDDLKNIGEKYGLRIVIPVTTVLELDGLKGSKSRTSDGEGALSDKSVGHLARWANDWIYSCLAKSVPTVVGQRTNQRLDRLATKDDAILDCCLYFQKEYPHTIQVLMSNDKNLCLRALAHKVLTVSYRKNMSAQLIAETVSLENVIRFGKIEANTTTVREREVAVKAAKVHHNVYETVFQEVQRLVLSIVHHCMLSSYGDDLDLVRNYDREQVLTLFEACQVMDRFWFPVFSQHLGRSPLDSEKMTDIPATPSELHEFVAFWSHVLHKLYQEELNESQNKALRVLVQRWDELAHSG